MSTICDKRITRGRTGVATPTPKQSPASTPTVRPASPPPPQPDPSAQTLQRATSVVAQRGSESDSALLARVADLQRELAAAQAAIAAKDAAAAAAAELATQKLAAVTAEKGKVEADLNASNKDAVVLGLQHQLALAGAKAALDEARNAEVGATAKRVREDVEAEAEAKRRVTDAEVRRLEAANRELVQSNEALAAAAAVAAAAAGGKPKKARGKKAAAAPASAAAAAMLAAGRAEGEGEGGGGGEGEAPPAKPAREGPSPYAQFECATREWTPAHSGASGFFELVGVESVADFKSKFESDAHWCAQLLASPELPTDFEAALRAVCDHPDGAFVFAEGGEAYKNLAMLVGRLGWPSLGITADQTKITQGGDAEQAEHIGYQIKKAISGINQVVQPYNLYRQLVLKDAAFTPITMTAKRETRRKGKAMYATRKVRATAAGFGTVEEHERSLAERQRAEDAAAEAVAQLAASMEMDEAP